MIGDVNQKAEGASSRGAASYGSESRGAARAFLVAVVAVGVFAAAAYLTGTTVCPLKRLIGVPCASCGSTRAAFALLSGDIPGAFAFNPLAAFLMVAVLPVAALSFAAFGFDRTKSVAASFLRRPLSWVFAVAAVAANWAYVIRHGN